MYEYISLIKENSKLTLYRLILGILWISSIFFFLLIYDSINISKFFILLIFILLSLCKSLDNRILDISISKEFRNALSIYLFLEKFTSISPSTFTLFTIKIFSSEKLFENIVIENIVAVKMINIYSLNLIIKYFNIA